jgi:hypothetical protein
MGLGLTAIASTLIGATAAKRNADRGKVVVPGTPSNFSKKLFLAPLAVPPKLGFVPKSMYHWLPKYDQGSGLWPLRPGQWGWLDVESIELPDPPYLIGLVQFTFLFDSDPGQAQYKVEARLGPSTNRWLLLGEGTNLFGGLYAENILAHLDPEFLQGKGPIHVRFGIMYKRKAYYDTDLPPIALRLDTDPPLYQAGKLDLWNQWDSKPVNIRG